jgi:enoyl-CoA hydratase/carnithine racemase
MTSFKQILYGVADRIATVTLNRPERLNAWTQVMDREVQGAMMTAASDDEVRAIVVTGAGRGFCAGADMDNLSAAAGGTRVIQQAKASPDNFAQRFSYMLAVPKPIVAGINGPIAGIGLCFALYCDLRYMADGAKLTTAFARRGLIAEYGIAWMLPRLVGPMNALDVLLSARPVSAAEAATLGLVRLLPAAGFVEAVHTTAAELAQLSSPRSMRIIKHQVYQSYFQTLAEASQLANDEMTESFATEDFKEGVAHFVEKRRPSFTRR